MQMNLEQRLKGKIKWYNPNKGFGFISGDNGEVYFMHYSSIQGVEPNAVMIDDKVTFEAGKNEKGPLAKKVMFEGA
jgi:CspA family cold shock protein